MEAQLAAHQVDMAKVTQGQQAMLSKMELWATQKELDIQTLLSKATVDPKTLDATLGKQVKDLRAYLNQAINVAIAQLKRNQ